MVWTLQATAQFLVGCLRNPQDVHTRLHSQQEDYPKFTANLGSIWRPRQVVVGSTIHYPVCFFTDQQAGCMLSYAVGGPRRGGAESRLLHRKVATSAFVLKHKEKLVG